MKSDSLSFSVIIPTLNEARTLPRLLKDLSRQTFTQFEIIVVDGRSDDHTLDKTNPFLSQFPIQLLISDVRNAGHQRNLGAKAARGKFLIFLDADSRIPKYFIQEIDLAVTKFGKKFNLAATWIKADTKSELDNFLTKIYNQLLILNKDLSPAAQATGLIVRRSLFSQVRGFNPELTFAEDRDLVKRICQKGRKLLILKSPLLTFSFRRFRRKGYGNTLGKLFYLNLYATLKGAPPPDKTNYDMGGKI